MIYFIVQAENFYVENFSLQNVRVAVYWACTVESISFHNSPSYLRRRGNVQCNPMQCDLSLRSYHIIVTDPFLCDVDFQGINNLEDKANLSHHI